MSNFTLRKDKNGWRPIFLLGNELGKCPFDCRFCNVKTSKKISSKDNINLFDKLYSKYSRIINESYHPLIYNRGNVTNPKEFSSKTLNHILECFNNDYRIRFVSLNSREIFINKKLLNHLANKKLNYPIHFILGVESFSKNVKKILGKNNIGELPRLIRKLRSYNLKYDKKSDKKYIFGIDVNLLFLPELYFGQNETRKNFPKISEGIKFDLKQLLSYSEPSVPMEINIHPFCQVKNLPYKNTDINMFMKILPDLQKIIKHYNHRIKYKAHLFIGVGGNSFNKNYFEQIKKWKIIIENFNKTGFTRVCF